MALSRLHGCRSVLNSLWTLFPLVVFPFPSLLLYWKELKRGSSFASHAHFPTFSIHLRCDGGPEPALSQPRMVQWSSCGPRLPETGGLNGESFNIKRVSNKGSTSTSVCLRCIRLPYQQLRRVFPYWRFQITAWGGDETWTGRTSGQEFYPSPFGLSPQTTTEGIPQECPLVWAPPFTDFMQSVVVMGQPSFLMRCCECVYVMQNRERKPHTSTRRRAVELTVRSPLLFGCVRGAFCNQAARGVLIYWIY